jgi:quercetin dioxygenase-like cupin family protein
MFVKVPHPVILRNFMKDSDLTKTMTWKNILEKYGDEDVFLTRKELDGYPGKLRDVEDPAVYLHNSEKLFNKYPEIRNLFEYDKLEDYLTMKVGYEQLFIGKEGTGTPFHNAAVYNMFYMIDGKKKWWFVDPYDTFLAYPICVLGRAASIIGCLWPHEYNVEAFPLFKYCPVYYAEVGPGDVLFNPPWWWHSIKNSATKTVGVASRWHTDGIVGHKGVMSEEDYDIYRFGSFAFLNGLASWRFLHGILQEPSPKFDEHATLRETNNRFVHKQIKISEAGGVEVGGVMCKF